MSVSAKPQQEKQKLTISVSHCAEWGLVVALVSLFMWHAFVPAWRNLNSDFPNYYLAGSLFRQGVSLERIYEWTWFQRQNDRFGVRQGLVGFAPNPPVCALPIAPLTVFSPLTAKRIWLFINLGFVAAALSIIQRVTLLRRSWLLLIAFSCIVPLYSNFLLGQYYVLLLLLICAGYYASAVGKQFLAGSFLGTAAALKLFPAPFLLLFLWKRNWSAMAGFLCASIAVTIASVSTLGWGVHSVFLSEILPQVSRGDWLAPYDLWRNSFTTLWSHLFLYEPQFNPSPFISSSLSYVVAMSATTAALLFGFVSCSNPRELTSGALEWAATLPLCLLLSTTTGSYHPTVLMFAALIGIDAFWRMQRKHLAIALFAIYLVACAPVPIFISRHVPLRLAAVVSFYAVLLYEMRLQSKKVNSRRVMFASAVTFLALLVLNSRAIRLRSEDFSRRITVGSGVRASNPVPIAHRLAITDMQQARYAASIIGNNEMRQILVGPDVLSLAGTAESDTLYLEVGGTTSRIFRAPLTSSMEGSNPLFEGHDPVLSDDRKWLAFLRDERGLPEVWLTETTFQTSPRLLLPANYQPLEITVSRAGDIIAAAGPASLPHLVLVEHNGGAPQSMGIAGPTRYPALSPDGDRLAFSRRRYGSWHLFVRDLKSGTERQLTHSACNATYPSWENTHNLLYATDCGRGVGLTAIARVVVP